ncbi:hypothetical protein AM1BK_49250 [Neobacillus kokaensis]|uniref:Uncharacterized protein n=1 Tax=Neobacillus kokaensis TaxID=2759023 RepID=A0ABQ3NBT6_9BACI|nr:hypothetical protein AM1BK_49250 [Neobacillus kokaensis]
MQINTSLQNKKMEVDTREYFDDLNKAIEEDRIKNGKKPLNEKEEVKETKEIQVSTTDPDCGFMSREISQCTRSKNKVKVVTRHVWEEHKEKIRLNRLSKSGKMLYKFRKEKNRAKLRRL